MNRFNQISKILLIIVAIVGLTIGMTTINGNSKTSDNVKLTVNDGPANEATPDSKCGEGKCGGEAKVSEKVEDGKDVVKEAVDDAKCGEGKCG